MLKKIEHFVTNIMEYLGMALLLLMTATVCLTVFTRYFLGFTPGWGEELALISMVWFGFLSMAIGVSENLHIGITILDHALSKKMMLYLDIFKYAAVGAFSLFMISEGLTMTEIGLGNLLPGIQLSSAFLYAVVPLSGVAILAYSIIHIIMLVKNGQEV